MSGAEEYQSHNYLLSRQNEENKVTLLLKLGQAKYLQTSKSLNLHQDMAARGKNRKLHDVKKVIINKNKARQTLCKYSSFAYLEKGCQFRIPEGDMILFFRQGKNDITQTGKTFVYRLRHIWQTLVNS